MEPSATNQTANEFVHEVSHRQHAMAGAVIALSAGQGAALGEACMRISRDDQPALDDQAVTRGIERVAQIKIELLQWCDRDATAIADYVALRDAGDPLAGQELLCSAPAEVCRIAIEAANILQDFRPSVGERVRDDLEMAISLLAGAARAANLLLDSNLRIWLEPDLLAQFEPIQDALLTDIDRLSPLTRIRK